MKFGKEWGKAVGLSRGTFLFLALFFFLFNILKTGEIAGVGEGG